MITKNEPYYFVQLTALHRATRDIAVAFASTWAAPELEMDIVYERWQLNLRIWNTFEMEEELDVNSIIENNRFDVEIWLNNFYKVEQPSLLGFVNIESAFNPFGDGDFNYTMA